MYQGYIAPIHGRNVDDIFYRYNIRYGRVTATESEVEDAAKAADIHERIQTFPDGEGVDLVVHKSDTILCYDISCFVSLIWMSGNHVSVNLLFISCLLNAIFATLVMSSRNMYLL